MRTMTSNPTPVSADEILRHAEWIRRLASRLVADPATADDIVQQTWEAALRKPPAGGRSVQPWLARVLHNFARKRARSEERREARERAAARSEDEEPAAALVADRLECQRTLVDELIALREPYRSALVLRFFDELSTAEIARRQDVPDGTARWRIHRGLELLRTRLDGRHSGDRERWALLILSPAARSPLGAPRSSSQAASVSTGVLAMNGTLKTAAVLVVVVAGTAIGWRYAGRDPDIARPTTMIAGPVEAAGPMSMDDGASNDSPAGLGRRETVAAGASAVGPELGAAGHLVAKVRARFVDTYGVPLTGARLEIRDRHVGAESDRLGDLVLTLQPPGEEEAWTARLDASANGYAVQSITTRVCAGKTTWLGDIELPPGGTISGRVVDYRGRPVPDAVVETADAKLPPGDTDQLHLLGPLFGRHGLATVHRR